MCITSRSSRSRAAAECSLKMLFTRISSAAATVTRSPPGRARCPSAPSRRRIRASREGRAAAAAVPELPRRAPRSRRRRAHRGIHRGRIVRGVATVCASVPPPSSPTGARCRRGETASSSCVLGRRHSRQRRRSRRGGRARDARAGGRQGRRAPRPSSNTARRAAAPPRTPKKAKKAPACRRHATATGGPRRGQNRSAESPPTPAAERTAGAALTRRHGRRAPVGARGGRSSRGARWRARGSPRRSLRRRCSRRRRMASARCLCRCGVASTACSVGLADVRQAPPADSRPRHAAPPPRPRRRREAGTEAAAPAPADDACAGDRPRRRRRRRARTAGTRLEMTSFEEGLTGRCPAVEVVREDADDASLVAPPAASTRARRPPPSSAARRPASPPGWEKKPARPTAARALVPGRLVGGEVPRARAASCRCCRSNTTSSTRRARRPSAPRGARRRRVGVRARRQVWRHEAVERACCPGTQPVGRPQKRRREPPSAPNSRRRSRFNIHTPRRARGGDVADGVQVPRTRSARAGGSELSVERSPAEEVKVVAAPGDGTLGGLLHQWSAVTRCRMSWSLSIGRGARFRCSAPVRVARRRPGGRLLDRLHDAWWEWPGGAAAATDGVVRSALYGTERRAAANALRPRFSWGAGQ